MLAAATLSVRCLIFGMGMMAVAVAMVMGVVSDNDGGCGAWLEQ